MTGAGTDQSQIDPHIGTIITGPTDSYHIHTLHWAHWINEFRERWYQRWLDLCQQRQRRHCRHTGSAYLGLKMLLRCQTAMFPVISCRALRLLDRTFATLGVTPGTYVWSWGDDGPNQNFTLIIGAVGASIPEPASATLLGTALVGLLLAGALRRA